MNRATTIQILIFLIAFCAYAQNDTSTPYSLFALGVENKTATGGLTGLGNSGIAKKDGRVINIYNPANLGNMQQKFFLYEFGVNGSYSVLKNNKESQTAYNANISHVIVAFPLQNNLGISLGLLPYTKVGYNIDIINTVEGSTDNYLTRITGTGGLNKFYLAGGAKVGNLSMGVDVAFLFGSVNQETLISYQSLTSISDVNHYEGVKTKFGLQYTLPKINSMEFTLGAVMEIPTKLKGNQVRNSYKVTSGGTQIAIDGEQKTDLDSFELPLAFNAGVTTIFNKSFSANFDFKRLFWDDTNQYQNNERYTNQNIYAMGVEYLPTRRSTGELWSRMKYRLGVNYNTGFLNISNKKINSYFASVGFSIPFSKSNNNWLNISYSYGKEGTLEKELIQENFHKITININFLDRWFLKRKVY